MNSELIVWDLCRTCWRRSKKAVFFIRALDVKFAVHLNNA